MITREIPRHEWIDFFDSLSLQHEGWLVTLEVLDTDLGPEVEAVKLPLQGITADVSDDGADAITITLGQTLEEHLTHIIVKPTMIRIAETEEGGHQALQIESASGTTTIVVFRSTIPAVMVDDVAMR
jgi:hypothetical protein